MDVGDPIAGLSSGAFLDVIFEVHVLKLGVKCLM